MILAKARAIALCATFLISPFVLSFQDIVLLPTEISPGLRVAMSSEYITIPPGLLTTWGGVQPSNTSVGNDTLETFDVHEVAIGRARRALSVSIGGLGRTRETGIETNANEFSILGAPRRATQDETSIDPRAPPPFRRPQRSATISLSRSNVTSSRTSTASTRRPSNVEQSVFQIPKPVATSGQTGDNFYMLQSLNNYQFPGTAHNVTAPLPVLINRDSGWSPERKRSSAAVRPDIERVASDRSWAPGLDVIRRASIAIEDTFENLTNLARRSTLSDIYDKAKVRQIQLQRSTIVQVGFQYMFYLLILAFIFFVFVGIPLWKGVVWYIYIVFSQKLAIPVGTGVFLGIGFLFVTPFGSTLISALTANRRYAYLPLLIPFEKSAPEKTAFEIATRTARGRVNNDTALLIPCYKSESLIAATLEAALKVFPAECIFVCDNVHDSQVCLKTNKLTGNRQWKFSCALGRYGFSVRTIWCFSHLVTSRLQNYCPIRRLLCRPRLSIRPPYRRRLSSSSKFSHCLGPSERQR